MFCLDMSGMIMVPIDYGTVYEIEQKHKQTYSLLSNVSRIHSSMCHSHNAEHKKAFQ